MSDFFTHPNYKLSICQPLTRDEILLNASSYSLSTNYEHNEYSWHGICFYLPASAFHPPPH